MKKILISMLAAFGMVATSCQKDADITPPIVDGSEQNYSISLNLDSKTRSIEDYGTGEEVNRCIMEVYIHKADNTTSLYKRFVEPVKDKNANFNVRLSGLDSYTLVAWADYAGKMVSNNIVDLTGDVESSSSIDYTAGSEYDTFYKTTNDGGLQDIEIIDVNTTKDGYQTQPNDDRMDAFFGTQLIAAGAASDLTMTLKRPFAQLNITTNITGSTPIYVERTVTTSIPKCFNALSGEPSATKTIEPKDQYLVSTTTDASGVLHLSTEYIFAPKDGEVLVNLKNIYKDNTLTEILTKDILNLPIKRNYRTTVKGNLTTKAYEMELTTY